VQTDGPEAPRRFSTTRWSLVVAAAAGHGGEEARAALAELCRLYWYPIYAFVRRRYGPDDSADLTQSFFLRLIERGDFASADRTRGRFRSWLLGGLKHFLANEWDHATAQKRDIRKVVWLDEGVAERRYQLEPSSEITPERLYDRQFGLCLLERALERLRAACVAEGEADSFDKLKRFLPGPDMDEGAYRPIAESLGVQPNHLKVMVHRLRRRYGAFVREEIAELVETREQIDEEIRFLFDALGTPES
jgi:RNA polymerase sigma-70 factor (ECF subfamily)